MPYIKPKVQRLDKTPQETAKVVKGILRKKLEEFKKSLEDGTYTPQEALFVVKEELKDRIQLFQDNLKELSALEKGEKLEKKTPSNVSEDLMHRLKDEYGHDESGKSKAYATAWKISKRKKRSHKKSEKMEHSVSEPLMKEPAHKSENGPAPVPPSLQKDLYGLPGQPDSNAQMAHKLGKNVFEMLKMKKTNDVIENTFKQEMEDPNVSYKSESAMGRREEKELQDLRAKDSALPGDKPSADANPKETGSGGQIGSGKQTQVVHKDEKMGARISPILVPKPKIKNPNLATVGDTGYGKQGGSGRDTPTASMKPPMQKASYSPLSIKTRAHKNALMPAQQQSGKMPSMDKLSKLKEGYGPKLPFGKKEMLEDMEKWEPEMSSKDKMDKSY